MIKTGYFPEVSDLARTGREQEALQREAAAITERHFGRNVFIRGVVEISNFCRRNCVYCGMRRENRSLERYRADVDQIAELILEHRPRSVTDINFQAGEDPLAVREVVLPLIRRLRRESSLGISACLGSLRNELYDALQAAGAAIYILKFEMADPSQYDRMLAPGTLEGRLGRIRYLASKGWHLSSGFIAGFPGQPLVRVLDNFRLAAELPLDGCSVSPFIPGGETPLAGQAPADVNLALNCMAAARRMRPDWVIPAVSALNIVEPGSGYRRGLRSGANLVTINMTPPRMRDEYLLYKRGRFIMTEETILRAIEAEGREPSPIGLADYFQSRKPQLAVA